jgi:aerobic carbon-monoxide dehydrogenase large subunit
VPYVGSSVPGLLDSQLVAGRGQYTADVSLPEMGYMAVVRSPYAHARIVSINGQEAVNHPGVRIVITGEEIKKHTNPIPQAVDPRSFGGKGTEVYCLALDRVRYVGEPVAALVADNKYAAAEALGLIEVEYEDLPVVVDAEKALAANAPLLYPEWGTNEMLHVHFQGGDLDKAFAEADYVLEDTVRVHRHTGTPLEPRAYVAAYDRRENSLTLWASTQNPHPLRTTLAQTLRLQEGDIRVIQPQVGGGFGLKTPPYQEEPLICLLARLTGKPVKWIEERNEHLMVSGHAREQIHHFAVAFRQDGKVIGLKDRIIADVGTLSALVGWGMAFVTSFVIPGPYKIPNCEVDLAITVTNKCPWNAYRGFGKENACFLMDRVMDRVASHLGMDRAEVRDKNFVSPEEFPYTQISGATLDSGNYSAALKTVLSKAGYKNFAQEQKKLREQGRYLGIGISFELTPEGGCIPDSLFSGYDTSTVRVSPTGQVTVLTGVTSPGTGNETGIAQIVADELGVKLENIKVIQGDTTLCPYGLGNYSSRSILIGGSAALIAAREVRYKVVRVAASMLETSPEELEWEEGRIRIKRKPDREVAFNDVARYIYRRAYEGHALDMEPGLESTRYFRIPNIRHIPDAYGRINTYPSYPYAACAAIVEVDLETGVVTPLRYVAVHDCGVVINPLLVEGQFHGSVAQGVGGVLYEQLSYDENGQLLTGTFMDYTLPTAVEIPPMEVYHQVTPSPFTPLGTKGAGESGVSGPLGAIVSAVEDALSPFAITIHETPLTPNRVWRLIQEARQKRNP